MSHCGTSSSHCCWLGRGGKCQYVEPSKAEGFRWQCALRASCASWDEVYKSEEYKEQMRPFWDKYPVKGLGCGDWPGKGQKCNDCGEVGNG